MGGALGPDLAASWRRHQLQISWLLALMERYEDFETVSAYALDVVLAGAGIELEPGTREEQLEGLPPCGVPAWA